MNPSASDWIPKFLDHFEKQKLVGDFKDDNFFYEKLKASGFIYGVSVQALPNESISDLKLTIEEFTKVNLFHTLFYTFYTFNPEASFEDALSTILGFYAAIEKGKKGFFQKLTLSQSPSKNLEQVLSARIQEANNVLKKNTTSLITYALLYTDVLAFKHFLESPKNLKPYLDELESDIISCSFLALASKEKKNKYNIQLLELFESSSDYLNIRISSNQIFTQEGKLYLKQKDDLEKKYLLDLCILAVHDDHQLDASEYLFLQELAIILESTEVQLNQSINDLKTFSEAHSAKIQLFKYSNPVNQFYKNSTKTVKTLILRNKDRLGKELDESGELLVLLGQSAIRDLNTEEKIKVKDQLLDICKSIPSLTIFLLPGGTLLLPLLVKFIPKLLPSSFRDNTIKKK